MLRNLRCAALCSIVFTALLLSNCEPIESAKKSTEPTAEASDPTCDENCVRRSIVRVARGSGRDVSSCWGIIMAAEGRHAAILTAAHCVSKVHNERLSRRGMLRQQTYVDTSRGERFLIDESKQFPHPEFRFRAPGSPYDLALLMVDRDPGVERFVPVSTRRLDKLVVGQADIVAVEGGSQTFLSFPVSSQKRDILCAGTSGAPILERRGSGLILVGVVSSGPSDCTGSALATRADLFSPATMRSVLEAGVLPAQRPSCAQCIEAVGAKGERCDATYQACSEDRDCAKTLLDDGQGHDTLALSDLRQRLRVCATKNGCQRSCSE